MKNIISITFILLICFPWVESPLYARNVEFDNGVKIDLPIYKNKQVNLDGSVCVDVNRLGVTAMMCFYKNPDDNVVMGNGFFKYKNLSPQGVKQVPLLPDDALVYAEGGGYSFFYPTNKKRVGDFIVHEVDHILCKEGADGVGRPAICYAAALVSAKNPNMNPALFVFAIIEQPPTPGRKLSKKAVGKVKVINEIIKSIKIDK